MIDQRLVEIISRVLNLDPSQITLETSVEDTTEWDSLGHLRLILEIEATYGVNFPIDEVPSLTSVERLLRSLQQHKVL
jgi:acyl carrier protein